VARVAHRYRGRGTAEVTRLGARAHERLVVVDVSARGMCLERVGEPISVGTTVSIAPTFWPRSLDPLVGEVVWAALVGRVVARMGVRFHSLSEDVERLLVLHYAAYDAGASTCSFEELDAAATSPPRFCTTYPHAFLVRLDAPDSAELRPVFPSLGRGIHAVKGPQGARIVRLGRSESNEIVVAHRRISRHHATFERHATTGEYTLLDCGSHNHTRVDGLRLRSGAAAHLVSKSTLDFGGLLFSFLAPADMCAALLAARARAFEGTRSGARTNP
jgi:FHA domain